MSHSVKVPLQKKEKKVAHNMLGGVTIQTPKSNGPKKVILEKPSVKMIRHIRSLYIKAHLNRRPVSRVLIDDRSVANIIPFKDVAYVRKNRGRSYTYTYYYIRLY